MTLNKDKTLKEKQYEKNTWSDSTKSIWPCGCSIPTPHSHLTVGHQCECEKGKSELK